jgi:hypothetical protein
VGSKVEFWKQRTSGDRSPIVGGDLYDGWKIDDLLDAYVRQKSANDSLKGELAYAQTTKSWWIKGSSAVCLILLAFLITAMRDASPRPAAAKKPAAASSQQVEGSPGAASSQRVEGTSELPRGSLKAAALPCATGKWVTVLGSWHRKEGRAADLFGKLREIQRRAAKNAIASPINYTLLDKRQCDTLTKDYYILWNGPHPNSSAAIKTCHNLGWTTKVDDYWCYAAVIDPAYTGKRHIRPDEG